MDDADRLDGERPALAHDLLLGGESGPFAADDGASWSTDRVSASSGGRVRADGLS